MIWKVFTEAWGIQRSSSNPSPGHSMKKSRLYLLGVQKKSHQITAKTIQCFATVLTTTLFTQKDTTKAASLKWDHRGEINISFLEGKFKPWTLTPDLFFNVAWFLSLWKVILPLFTHVLWDYCSSLVHCFATYSKVQQKLRVCWTMAVWSPWKTKVSKGTKRMKSWIEEYYLFLFSLHFVSYLYEQWLKDDTCPFGEAWRNRWPQFF